MHWQALAPLLLTSLVVMGTPGPATISLTAVGSSFGVRRSLPYLAGIVAGTTIVLLAVATGITAALLAVPAMHALLLAVSVAYILSLAYRVATAPLVSAQSSSSDAPSLGAASSSAPRTPRRGSRSPRSSQPRSSPGRRPSTPPRRLPC
jgi:threonine/homoserine/homoserine lactone efflux protein